MQLLDRVRALSVEYGLEAVAVTFSCHPYGVLGGAEYRPLFSEAERAYLWEKLFDGRVYTYPFDRRFAEMPAEDFCGILFNDLNAKALVVGDGFRFGFGRAGTVETLRQRASECGAEVHVLPHYVTEGGKVGTRVIRSLLDERKPEGAARLLGFPFFILGAVTQGNKIGRRLGYPTVNIEYAPERYLPPDGVYATRTVLNGVAYKSVTNIGIKPTVSTDATERTVESFLIGFNGEVYGQTLKTEFLQFIRPERKFTDIEALKDQIEKDVGFHEKN
jgi:riboflavin kinase/FMN adenylyltransferase